MKVVAQQATGKGLVMLVPFLDKTPIPLRGRVVFAEHPRNKMEGARPLGSELVSKYIRKFALPQ